MKGHVYAGLDRQLPHVAKSDFLSTSLRHTGTAFCYNALNNGCVYQSNMTSTRVNEIDLLRFFAALLVVLFHYTFRGYAADALSIMPYPLLAPISKYGYLGVELFFIISGFVILMTASSGSLRSFLISRFVRLYPAFWICCTITFLLTIMIGAPRFSASISQYLVNMTMLSGFVNVPSIDGAYWSLFVELQFYALVALLLIIGRIHQAQRFLILWLMASIALTVIEVRHIGLLRMLLITDYSAYFIAGATYFLIWSQGASITRAATILACWSLAIFQSINRLAAIDQHYHTTMNGYVTAGLISSFFVLMLLVAIRCTGFWGRNRWLFAGVLTYPLYLLHQNIGYMIFNIAYPAVNPHLLLISALLGIIAMAYLVHVYIEKPFVSFIKNNNKNLH